MGLEIPAVLISKNRSIFEYSTVILSYTLQTTDAFSMKGRYSGRRIFIDESAFSFVNVLAEGEKIQGSMSGDFYTH
jgi:hypothetical protein